MELWFWTQKLKFWLPTIDFSVFAWAQNNTDNHMKTIKNPCGNYCLLAPPMPPRCNKTIKFVLKSLDIECKTFAFRLESSSEDFAP